MSATHPSEIARLPYRPCVGIMLLNSANQVFVAQRLNHAHQAWQMPQGGIDKGESPQRAALRELKEEIGTNHAEILAESKQWLSYDLPTHLAPKLWKGRYRGQTQKWFALRFLGRDSDIDLETEHPEFKAWRWAPADELPALIVPFKRKVYEQVLEEFSTLLA
ncbi:MAG: RNA pyrophosphohydrolase [Pseudomonadota bacterium]